MGTLVFKEAESSLELRQVHALNHRVFAEEIAQHQTNPSGLLIDHLHAQNRYFVAVRDEVVVGMISANCGPEFSVAKRLPDTSVVRDLAHPVELRLLAIHPQERNRTILAGLLWQAYCFSLSNGFSHLLISAIAQRESMYRKLGFRALAPAVREGSASFMPMVMQIIEQRRAHRTQVHLHQRHWDRAIKKSNPVSLMPGPVCINPRVIAAFASVPVSHRSPAFISCYERVRSLLKGLLSGVEVVLFPGGGTLANDAVAANLKAIFGDRRGLVISNGEFGERIADQAEKAGLLFHQLSFPWGGPWSLAAIKTAFDQKPAWVWAVQLETSTGVLNETEVLLKLAREAKCAVALDCVSSIGATTIANEVGPLFFASGVSGKSLGDYAGLAFVHLNDECRYLLSKTTPLCPSFNLLRMYETRGPLSTVLSSLVFALARSLEDDYGSPEAAARRFQEYSVLGQRTRSQMRSLGLDPVASELIAAPNITTFALPDHSFPKQCLDAGFQIAYESQYLQSRNWGQIATMGNVTSASLDRFFEALHRYRRLASSDSF
jgi:aspartate aminotransferase-like enzyme